VTASADGLRTLHWRLYHWTARRHGVADCIRRQQEI